MSIENGVRENRRLREIIRDIVALASVSADRKL